MSVCPAIPPRCHEAPIAYPDWAQNDRHHVECPWAGFEKWLALATRHEGTAASFMGVLRVAVPLDRHER